MIDKGWKNSQKSFETLKNNALSEDNVTFREGLNESYPLTYYSHLMACDRNQPDSDFQAPETICRI